MKTFAGIVSVTASVLYLTATAKGAPPEPHDLHADMIQSQQDILNIVRRENEYVAGVFNNTLKLEAGASFTPRIDLLIERQGRVRRASYPTPEDAIWGYMEMPQTVLTVSLNPFKRGLFGKDYQVSEVVYGYWPAQPGIMTNARVLGSHAAAKGYLVKREAALIEDRALDQNLMKLGATAGVFLAKFAISGGTIVAAESLTSAGLAVAKDYASSYFKEVLASSSAQAAELNQTLAAAWLNPSDAADEQISDSVDALSRAMPQADNGVPKDTRLALFSLYRGTLNKIKAVKETEAAAQGDSDVWPALALASREARLGTEDLARYFSQGSDALEADCAKRIAAAIASVKIYSQAVIKENDLAYSRMIQAKAECLAGRYILLATEARWMKQIELAL